MSTCLFSVLLVSAMEHFSQDGSFNLKKPLLINVNKVKVNIVICGKLHDRNKLRTGFSRQTRRGSNIVYVPDRLCRGSGAKQRLRVTTQNSHRTKETDNSSFCGGVHGLSRFTLCDRKSFSKILNVHPKADSLHFKWWFNPQTGNGNTLSDHPYQFIHIRRSNISPQVIEILNVHLPVPVAQVNGHPGVGGFPALPGKKGNP